MADHVYPNGKKHLIDNADVWGSDDCCLSLLTSSYAYSRTHTSMSPIVGHRLTNGKSGILQNTVVTYDENNDRCIFESDEIEISGVSSGQTIISVVLHTYHASDPAQEVPLAFFDGFNITTDGGNITVTCPNNEWFYI